MYERFYNLRDRPFALSPDPDYLYPSRVHREALDYLRFGIEGHAGFVVITGEIGSGKTTLLQVLLRNLDGQTTVVRLVNTLLTGRELLESILLDLDVSQVPPTKPTMLRELARVLIDQRSRGRRVLAVIDEAQNLSLDALEELRMLSNLETEKSKLLQIVLVGQPDLRDKLALQQLEQLRQRVTVRYHIEPLDAEETANYINHRLRRAAAAAPLQFNRDVTDAVHARSNGVPRLINVICDAVLLFGYADERRLIDRDLVEGAIEELEASSVLRPVSKRPDSNNEEPPVRSTETPRMSAPPSPEPMPVQRPLAMTSVQMPAAAPRPAAEPVIARPAPWETRPQGLDRSASTAGRAVQPLPAAQARPIVVAPPARSAVAVRSEAARYSSSAWGWMKEVFFGVVPER
jgi:putative secretion ATPase (PEP-CTERM system associated)